MRDYCIAPFGTQYFHRNRDTVNKVKFFCHHFGVLVPMVAYGAIVKRAYSLKTAVFICDSSIATDY